MPQGMRVNGAPAKPIGSPDIVWGAPGTGGYLTEWSETVPDLCFPESVRTYGRLRHDPKATAVLSAYFLPILRCTWAVDPAGVDRAEAVDLVAADLGLPVLGQKGRPKDSPIRGFRWKEHVRLALLSLVYGLMPFERWFDTSSGRTRLAGIQERLPHTITNLDIDETTGAMRSVEQSTQLEPIPANRLTWYVNGKEGANYAGVSLLRPCYTPWILKHEVMRVHATSHRRWGMGIPVVHAPPGATPAQVEEARRLAAGMRAGDQAGAGLPAGFDFELAGMTGNTPDAVAFINFLNQEIAGSALAKVIELGTTSEGSRALGDTFLDLFLLALQAGADTIGDTATYGDPAMPGLSRALVDYNWGEDEPCPRIVAADVGDRHEITAAAIQQLVASGAITPDDDLENFLREAWSLPARKTPRPVSPPPGTRPPGPPTPGEGPGPGGGPQPGEGGGPGLPPPPRQHQTPAAAARPDGLRRDLTPVEAAAGLDPEGMHRELTADTDRVLTQWAPVLRAQRADLADQVSAAVDDGHLDRLAALTAPTSDAAEILYRAMASAAAKAAGRMIGEAAGQGVTIDPAAVKIDHERLRKLATARAVMAANALAVQASRRALQVVTASAGTQAAQQVTATLAGLSPTSLADELMAALHAATNEARFAVLDAGPEASYVASEIRDQNTCTPCKSIDGYQFTSLADARAAYANGGYAQCDGGLRCRGTVVATWEEPPAPGTPEAYEEGLYGPLGQHLGPSSWRDIGKAATAAEDIMPDPS